MSRNSGTLLYTAAGAGLLWYFWPEVYAALPASVSALIPAALEPAAVTAATVTPASVVSAYTQTPAPAPNPTAAQIAITAATVTQMAAPPIATIINADPVTPSPAVIPAPAAPLVWNSIASRFVTPELNASINAQQPTAPAAVSSAPNPTYNAATGAIYGPDDSGNYLTSSQYAQWRLVQNAKAQMDYAQGIAQGYESISNTN
jgi:hypothetical protein